MNRNFSLRLALIAILTILGIATLFVRGSAEGAAAQTSPPRVIACRALEVHTTAQTTLVIFHQREKQDHPKVSEFLQAHSEGTVQFQTSDGAWHDATVIRLKSCFGRGLLIFPAGRAKLAEKDAFELRAAAPK